MQCVIQYEKMKRSFYAEAISRKESILDFLLLIKDISEVLLILQKRYGYLEQKRISEIAFTILHYLKNNPDAQDTLDGITSFWLLKQKIQFEIEYVFHALDLLVQKDMILPNQNVPSQKLDNEIHYCVNPKKFDMIDQILDELYPQDKED